MRRGALGSLLLAVPLAAASALTPQALADQLEAVYASISDYQCRMHESCSQGERFEERTIDFSFKRPRMIRMDIRRGNRFADTGSVGVYRGDGKVVGRKGGILGFIVITVDKHDAQATTIRGRTFDQSDLQATLETMRFLLANGASTLAENAGVYELAFSPRDPAYGGGVTREVIRLDAVTLLPVGSESYEGERLVQQARWDHYILNAGIPDELFDVRWDPAQLERMGIASVSSVPLQ